MNIQKKRIDTPQIQAFIKNNWIFYLSAFLALFGIKYFYSQAACRDLTWILAPTAWGVRTLSGIPFTYDPYEGYVNYTCRFVIAPSCSGIQFMMITIATLVFPFIHRMDNWKKKCRWMASGFFFSYLLTILVNTIRIIVSIYLPVYMEQKSLLGGFLTPARLHTLIGTSVYFTSLLLIYHLAGAITRQSFHKCLPPVFFYFALVLGVPFLNRAYQKGSAQFAEYSALVICVCLIVLSAYRLGHVLVKFISKNAG